MEPARRTCRRALPPRPPSPTARNALAETPALPCQCRAARSAAARAAAGRCRTADAAPLRPRHGPQNAGFREVAARSAPRSFERHAEACVDRGDDRAMDRSDIARRVDQDTALGFCFGDGEEASPQPFMKFLLKAFKAICNHRTTPNPREPLVHRYIEDER